MATTTDASSPAPLPDRMRRVSLAQRVLAKPAAGALVIVVFVWVVFAVLSTARGNSAFLSIPGTLGYLDVAAQVGIIGTAVALLMIAGEFDLSVGSMVGFAGIMIGICVTIWGLPIWLSIIIAVALTTGLGVINGILVVRTGLPSFIVTLATLFIIAGLSSVLTSLVTNITYIPISPSLIAADPLAAIFTWKLSFKLGDQTTDFQASIVWWIIIATVGAYILGRRRFGNWIAGVGGSPSAARNLGVPVARVKITLFATTAFSAAILADHPEHALLVGRHPARRRPRADRHHDGRHRRLPADRRLRLGGRDRPRRAGPRHGPDRHRVCLDQRRLEQDRDRHAAPVRGRPEQLDPASLRRIALSGRNAP